MGRTSRFSRDFRPGRLVIRGARRFYGGSGTCSWELCGRHPVGYRLFGSGDDRMRFDMCRHHLRQWDKGVVRYRGQASEKWEAA